MANSIDHLPLGRKRAALSIQESESPPLKKISPLNSAPLLSGECCLNPNQAPRFLNREIKTITSIFKFEKELESRESGTVFLVTCPHDHLFVLKKIPKLKESDESDAPDTISVSDDSDESDVISVSDDSDEPDAPDVFDEPFESYESDSDRSDISYNNSHKSNDSDELSVTDVCNSYNSHISYKNSNESNEILTCLGSITNPNIIKFYSEYLVPGNSPFSEATDQLIDMTRYLAFEYIEGFSLDVVFSNRHFITKNMIHYMMDQFFKINFALDKYKIIHNDLCFKNIMYCSNSKMLKVIDFGYSRIAESQDQIELERQSITLFVRLRSQIIPTSIFSDTLQELGKGHRDRKQLVSWIEFKSKILPQESLAEPLKFYIADKGQDKIIHIDQAIFNKNSARIMIWSTILSIIYNNKALYSSYLNHFTVERFLRLQPSLSRSNDHELYQLYFATRDIES